MAHEHRICSVQQGSIAWEMGIEPGDKLLAVDGQEIEDVFDYRYYIEEEELVLLIEKPDGEQWELEIEKESYEDLGMEFEQGLMDEYRSCRNRCIFCFIDQMPPGMRDTLYFKDDDSRLSFLQGNYVTLTNMSGHDLERIIRFRLEPINISFQTMNPDLRCRMLHNRFAGEALKKVDTLYEAGIEMNGQIVLCKGFNDGEELDRQLQILEMTFTVDHRGGMRIPAPVLAKMGLTAGDHVRVAYLTHDSVSNTFCELMLLPDADDETAAEKASVIHLPAELMQQASIPQDADLQITCLNGCIVINRDTGFQPEELYPILENLQTAEALASMLPGEAQKTLAKLEQTIERIQKGAEQDE